MRGHIETRGEGKNRSYRVKVYLGRDANSGKQKFLTHTIHTTKKDAEKWLNAKLREIELGEFVPPTTTTFGELLDLWLAGKRGAISDRTYTDYKYAIDTYIRPRLGSTKASALTSKQLKLYYEYLRDERQLGNRTVRHLHILIKAALGEAVRHRQLARNPADAIKTPRKMRQITIRFFKPNEAREFWKACKNDKHGIIFAFALETGMRPEEYLALQWTDLDLAKNEIAITRTLYWPRTGGYQFIDRTKSKNSQRIISISAELMKQLRDHRATQLIYKSAMNAKGNWKEHNLIFAADTGAPFFTHNLARYFKRLLTNAGLDPAMRLYDLRHSCATLLLTNGVNPKIVSERLGHASVAFTLDTYCHVLPNDQQMATEAMIRMVGCCETGGKQEDQSGVISVN
jgi:integrase